MIECDLCKKEMEETFLGKLKGAIVKIKKDDKNVEHHVCPECQKKYKDIKAELEKQ